MTVDNDPVCRASISLGNQCGRCSKCRSQIKAMYEGLLTIAARADDLSPPCIRAYVADALGVKVADLERMM